MPYKAGSSAAASLKFFILPQFVSIKNASFTAAGWNPPFARPNRLSKEALNFFASAASDDAFRLSKSRSHYAAEQA